MEPSIQLSKSFNGKFFPADNDEYHELEDPSNNETLSHVVLGALSSLKINENDLPDISKRSLNLIVGKEQAFSHYVRWAAIDHLLKNACRAGHE